MNFETALDTVMDFEIALKMDILDNSFKKWNPLILLRVKNILVTS